MHILKEYKVGLIAGFLFGTVGLFVLAALSLISNVFEIISAPLLFLGKSLAPSNGSTVTVILLTLVNGIFYALVGAAVQFIIRKIKN
jgi:hypothetical protein